MAITLGHIEVELLARVADGEPVILGTVSLPVEVQHGPVAMGRIVIDPAKVRTSLASALADASAAVDR